MELRNIVVGNPLGLHLRVAAQIVKVVRHHDARVTITRDQQRAAQGDSVIELLLLDAAPGTAVRLTVDGPNEKAVADEISELFSDGSGI